MKISLCHPSRGRPLKAVMTAEKWITEAGVPVEHIFSLDESDRYHKAYKTIDKLLVNPNDCVVQATNHAAKASTGDVLLYLSDDVDCYKNWGQDLERICSLYSGEYLIKVNDGLQPFKNDVLTFPIMSRPLYEKLGYFFHPSYSSMWVDVDLYHVCERLGVLKFHSEIKYQHNHYCNGKAVKDDTYIRSDRHFETGRQIHKQRQRQGYP